MVVTSSGVGVVVVLSGPPGGSGGLAELPSTPLGGCVVVTPSGGGVVVLLSG